MPPLLLRRLRLILDLLVANEQQEGAASNKRRGRGIFPNRRHETLEKTAFRAVHRTISFTVSLSFSSWRIVSRGARLRVSSRLMPIPKNTPASTAATITEGR